MRRVETCGNVDIHIFISIMLLYIPERQQQKQRFGIEEKSSDNWRKTSSLGQVDALSPAGMEEIFERCR